MIDNKLEVKPSKAIDIDNVMGLRAEVLAPDLNVTEFNKKHLQYIADLVSTTVGNTLGPMGRNVLIDRPDINSFESTKDGISVLGNLYSDNNTENKLIKAISSASMKVVKESGDGTTTAIIFLGEFIKRLSKGIESLEEKHGEIPTLVIDNLLDQTKQLFTTLLATHSLPLLDIEQYETILRVSLNNNLQLVGVVMDGIRQAMETEGKKFEDITLTYQSSQNGKFKTEYTNGYKLNNNTEVYSGERKGLDTRILMVSNGIVGDKVAKVICDLIDQFQSNPIHSNELLLISSLEVSYAARLLINKHITANYLVQKGERCRVLINEVDAPGLRAVEVFEDVIKSTMSIPREIHENVDISDFNFEKLELTKINTTRNHIVIDTVTNTVNGVRDNSEITELLDNLKDKKNSPTITPQAKLQLQMRIDMMTNSVLTIYVGGTDRMDIDRNRSQLDDATKAIDASIKGGYIAGGCSGIAKVAKMVKDNVEFNNGHEIRAIESFAMTTNMLENIGINKEVTTDMSKLLVDTIYDSALSVMGYLTKSIGKDVSTVEDIISDYNKFDTTYDVLRVEASNTVINPTITDITILDSALSTYKNLLVPKVIVHSTEDEASRYISRVRASMAKI